MNLDRELGSYFRYDLNLGSPKDYINKLVEGVYAFSFRST